ncbi:hemin uptake protein HemP [Methylomarinum sp. Ch1-1]|uniref:Hemin uptake protein HemP n=1 Tax=Methylomarinum roseum TaxID=3067653 RepID=A0AAU7NZJ6_9GAMM|nr:hemin uptake protein HemP [Methylomarinum sp. Ch1-1]MDP4521438.1 hemin uptake protein HemP [Methylomarinum sp. Ch1-1]
MKRNNDSLNARNSDASKIKNNTEQRLFSSELFATASTVVIEHDGEEYRLRLTSRGKLILTK